MRRIAIVFALLLVLAAPAAAARGVVDRGLVVRVRPFAIVIRALDGSRERFRVSPATVVLLDGKPATIQELKRGDVAFVQHVRQRPAIQIRAFSR